MTRTEISNNDDVIDSRDVIARIEELQEMYDDAQQAATGNCLACGAEIESPAQWQHPTSKQPFCSQACAGSPEEDWKGDVISPVDTNDNQTFYPSVDFDESEYEELAALKSLADEASGSPDWKYGETLIRDSYFTKYAEQLADDLGYIGSGKTDSWPFTCIDWEQAARELQQDYTSVDFDGVEYWIRS